MNKVFLLILMVLSILYSSNINEYNKTKLNIKLQKNILELQHNVEKLEIKFNSDINSLNNRIESFGNYLEISNSKVEKEISLFSIILTVIVGFFGILMTILVIYFGIKSNKEAKHLAQDAIDSWIKNEAKEYIEKVKIEINKHLDRIQKGSEEFDNILRSQKYRLIEDSDIDVSLKNKRILASEVNLIKTKAIKKRTFSETIKLILFEIINNNYSASILKIDNALKQYNDNIQKSRLYFLKAVTYDKQSNDKAIECYLKSIEEDNSFSDSYRQLAHYYSSVKRDYKKAIEYFEKAIKINQYDYKAYARMGIVYRKLGNNNKAEECYRKAIEINPDSRLAYNNLGYLKQVTGDAESALKYFKLAIEAEPEYAISSYNNIFRMNIIKDGIIDKELEKEYLKKYNDKEFEQFSSYELYKIIEKLLRNEDIETDIINWKNKWKNKQFRLFGIKPLFEWAENYKNKEISNKLLKLLKDVKKFYI